jgi:TrmH family RNA methyltransferase
MREAGPSDVGLLRSAAADGSLVLLDGFHAVKHAVRFGAEVLLVATSDPDRLARLTESLSPADAPAIERLSRTLPPDARIALDHRTGVWGVATRPRLGIDDLLYGDGHVVVLEDPRRAGNVGAVIRVAAAAGAGGVLVVGDIDPWSPAAVRGAAGLQFAVRVARTDTLPETKRPIVALDPGGEDLDAADIPSEAILAFGTERDGISRELAARADLLVRLPMAPGVSSLNLAVAVGVTLYALR